MRLSLPQKGGSMRPRILLVTFSWAMALFATSRCAAEGPELMSFQAYLKRGGKWVTTNGVPVCFSFYGSPTGGQVLYRECDIVEIKDGLYSTHIGDNPAPGHPYGRLSDVLRAVSTNAWLGISVGGSEEFVPRQRISAAAYVIAAESDLSFSVTKSYTYAAGTTQSMDVVTANRLLVYGEASFAQGIRYLAPLGDLSMGSFTNRPRGTRKYPHAEHGGCCSRWRSRNSQASNLWSRDVVAGPQAISPDRRASRKYSTLSGGWGLSHVVVLPGCHYI